MSDNTGIEWTDATWNPVWGCTPVSPGCDHCYAETLVNGRLAHLHPGGFGVVRLRPEQLDKPLRWKRPRRIFVNSMSDLFHDQVPDDYIARVFAIMAEAPQHTFQVLTKRHGRMRSLLSSEAFYKLVDREWCGISDWYSGRLLQLNDLNDWRVGPAGRWPLPNVWLGVSVENQQWADIRIPALLDTPAAVRFLSCEPLLGPVNLDDFPWEDQDGHYRTVDWVIVGGESGHGARPMRADWARSLRDQCQAAGIAFHFKQWGEHLTVRTPSGEHTERVGKKYAGRELDGRTWDEYPQAVNR